MALAGGYSWSFLQPTAFDFHDRPTHLQSNPSRFPPHVSNPEIDIDFEMQLHSLEKLPEYTQSPNLGK